MIKLGTKIPGSFGVGIRFVLLNAAAILFVFLTIIASGSSFGGLIGCLFLALSFPANQFSYSNSTETGGGWSLNFFFLNPLVWGLIAFAVHKATNSTSPPSDPGSKEFHGHPCVSCQAPTNPNSDICPNCGWTQPR